MKNSLYKKSIVFTILVVLIGAVAIPNISGNDITKSENIIKPQPAPEVLFYDDFNDNTKDMTKWTEEFTAGTWWERNQQTEFRIYESHSYTYEGITSTGIPVTLDEPLVVECIMDTHIDSSGGNWVGQSHFKVVDSNDDANFIDVYYKRDINEIRVRNGDGFEMSIGTNDEFRFKVTITIQTDQYKVEVGPYTTGWQAKTIFPSECTLKVKIYLKQAGDSTSYWWIAGFDDVAVNGKKRSKNVNNNNMNEYELVPVNTVKPLSRGDVLFSDDFNDNSKDMTKWTEESTDGTWWERNQQTEFRVYEPGGGWNLEGITSTGIPVTLDDDPVIVECIMDTFIDNYPDPYYQYVGRTHLRVADSDDETNFIDVYYSRSYDEIYVKNGDGFKMSIGTTGEFRFKVTITIHDDKYMAEVGPYTSGWIAKTIFPSECTLKVKIYLAQAGDYTSFWWIAGFDDIVVSKGEGGSDPDKPARPSGPTSGKPGEEYTYTTYYTDPEGEQVYYMWDWADGTFSDWIGPFDSGDTVSATHSWDDIGTYSIRVKAKDVNNNESDWSNSLTVTIENDPPDIPQINGPTSGTPGVTYSFTLLTTDPDDDDLYYEIDWGDGAFDPWDGPYMSNEVIVKSHSWGNQGTFRIRARAKDTFGNIGDWGELEVIIPRDKTFNNPFIQFLKSHPNMFPILQQILVQFGL